MSPERIAEAAEFKVYLKIDVDDYWRLTAAEREALVKAHNAAVRKRR